MDAATLLAEVRNRRAATAADAAMALALYPASPLDDRRRLAALAAPALAEPAVAVAWLACATGEDDPAQRDALVGRLFGLRLPAGTEAEWAALLLASLERPDLRHGAAEVLRPLLPARPELVDRVVGLAASAADPALRDHLDLILLDLPRPTPALAAHWRSRLAGSGLGVRLRLAARLCDHDLLDEATAGTLLDPGESEAVRELVLRHWLDRGRCPAAAAARVLEHDPAPGCRALALDLLAGAGSGPVATAALLQALQRDAVPALRQRAALAIAGWGDAGPDLLADIVDRLRAEPDRHAFAATVAVLGPVLVRQPALRAALAGLLTTGLEADAAAAVCAALAPCARADAAVREALLAVCESATSARVRGPALAALAAVIAPDPGLEPSFRRALRSQSPELRSWGVQGFLRLDILAIDPGTAQAAADALRLLGPGGGYDARQQRLQLMRKLAVLRPQPPILAELADRDDDSEGRDLARRLVQAAAATTPAKAFDWDDALERIEARRDANGLFPAVLEQAHADPAAARRVLRAIALALLTTGLDGVPCSFHDLVPHLARCGALDEAVVRALAQRLRAEPGRSENPSPDLAVLRAHPRLPEVAGALEAVLAHARRVRPGLLRDLLHDIHGGDERAAIAWLHTRLLAIRDPAVAEGLLDLVKSGEEWTEPDAVLRGWHAAFSARPGADRLVRELETTCTRWKIALDRPSTAQPPPPGELRRSGGLLDD